MQMPDVRVEVGRPSWCVPCVQSEMPETLRLRGGWHPAGMRGVGGRCSVVSLRSNTGYRQGPIRERGGGIRRDGFDRSRKFRGRRKG